MSSNAKSRKSANRSGVHIPSRAAGARRDAVGEIVDRRPVKVVKPKRRRYKLDDLVAQFKPEHRHGEWDLGDPVGREIW